MCVFHLSWGLRDFMIEHFDHVATFDCPEPGSFHSELTFVLELSTGTLQKCKKHSLFDTKSLQIGELPTGSSKYVPNRVLFRKRRILRNRIKPSYFAQFPWSSNLNLSIFLQLSIDLHKNCGAIIWNSFLWKKHGAQNSKCTASWESKHIEVSSRGNESPKAICGGSSHGNGYPEVIWGEKR